MSRRESVGGPPDVVRPFIPTQGHNGHQEDLAETLDHIATALSAIDHNVAVLIARLDSDTLAVKWLAASLEGTPS